MNYQEIMTVIKETGLLPEMIELGYQTATANEINSWNHTKQSLQDCIQLGQDWNKIFDTLWNQLRAKGLISDNDFSTYDRVAQLMTDHVVTWTGYDPSIHIH